MGAPMTDGARITQLQVKVEELEGEAKEFNQFSRDATKWIGERDRYLTALKEIAKKRCITEALQGLNDPLPPIDECKCSTCIAIAVLREE